MADPTPRWGWPRPVETDTVDPVRDLRALALALDVVAVDDQGALADRPVSTPAAPGKEGRYYYALDTGILSRDYGTGWQDIGYVADGSITTAKIANLNVTTGKLADLSVINGKLADGAVDSRVISDGSVAFGDLAAALKPSQGAAGAAESLRALGSAAGTAAAGLNPTIGGRLTLQDQGVLNGIQIGGDANLYRSAVNTLKTDGQLLAGGGFRIGAPLTGAAYQGQQVAAQALLQNLLVGTDANPAFSILGDGKHQWGLGGASPVDANLYRGAIGVIKTDGSFNAVGGYQVSGASLASTHLADSASLARLSGADLTLTGKMTANGGYLIGAALTGTPAYQSQQVAAQTVLRNKLLSSDTQDTFHILGSGKHEWGPGGATAPDLNLYRNGAGQLKTDFDLIVNGNLVVANNNVSKLYFGSANDTNLYRASGGQLKTDTQFYAGQELIANIATTGTLVVVGAKSAGLNWAGISFGSTQDTNLYRAGTSCLKTDSGMSVAGSGVPGTGASLEFGTTTPPSPIAYFQAQDRGGVGAIPLHLQGSEVSLYDAAAHQRLRIDATGIGFLGATPVAQQSASGELRSILFNYGLIAAGTNLNSLNIGGQIVGSGIWSTAGAGIVGEGMVRAQGNNQGPGSSGIALEILNSGGTGIVQSRDTGSGLLKPLIVQGSSVTIHASDLGAPAANPNIADAIKITSAGIGFLGNTPAYRRDGGLTYNLNSGGTSHNLPSGATLGQIETVVRQILLDFGQYGLLSTIG